MKIFEQYFDERGENFTQGPGYVFRVYAGEGKPYQAVLSACNLETREGHYTMEAIVFGSGCQKLLSTSRRSKKRDIEMIQEAKNFLPTMLENVREFMTERKKANA